MNKETGLPGLGLHKFITVFYLPITIALSIYVAVGNVYDIGRLTFSSLESYIDAFILMFPFVTAVLFTVSLVGLLGLTHFGRRAILFATTFRIMMLLVIIFGEMTYGRMLKAGTYALVCLVNILVYAYYRRREFYFVAGGQTLSEAYEIRRKSRMPSPIKKCAPVSEVIEEEQSQPQAETPSSPEEKNDEKAETERKEDVYSSVVTVTDTTGEYSHDDVQKRCKYIYAEDKDKVVSLLSSTLVVLKNRTIVSLEVENRTDAVYSESDWTFMRDIKYTSHTTIGKGTTVVRAEISQPFDRISISLDSVK